MSDSIHRGPAWVPPAQSPPRRLHGRRVAFLGLLPLLALLGSPAASTAAQEASQTLSLDHYLEWEEVGEARLSPDGSQVVYTRRFMDAMNDRWASALWIMDADGTPESLPHRGLLPPLVSGRDAPGLRCPGGALRQPDLRPLDGCGRGHLPDHPDPAGPGEHPVVSRRDPDPLPGAGPRLPRSSWSIQLPQGTGGASWTGDPIIEDRIHFRRDGQGWTPRGSQHLFVVDATGGAPVQITSGDWDHSNGTWMPDGRSVVFQSLRVEDADRRWREAHLYSGPPGERRGSTAHQSRVDRRETPLPPRTEAASPSPGTTGRRTPTGSPACTSWAATAQGCGRSPRTWIDPRPTSRGPRMGAASTSPPTTAEVGISTSHPWMVRPAP
jgi:dipeptidyl aminopeptidase/acylaminoacyl peptidase